jgi:hypothetical protein
MEKKTKKIFLWVWFAFSVVVLLLTGILLWAILNKSKWWFLTPLIVISISWIVIGIILLINKLNAQLPESTKIDPKDALEKVKFMTKYDEDNADNLEILDRFILRLGRKDHPPTPIFVILGRGTEKGQKRCFLVNLNNPDKEVNILINKEPEEIWRTANLLAEYPADLPITEKITESLQFGMPTKTTERVIPSSAKEREELEKKEAEEKSAS